MYKKRFTLNHNNTKINILYNMYMAKIYLILKSK